MPVQLSKPNDDEGDEARIEIIPLIDIMFFLLASFMLVSLSMTHMHRVPINLPTASSSVAESKNPPFHLAIDAAGVTTWEGQIVSLSEVTQRLKSAGATHDSRVLIAADENARHKQVLSLLNAIRDAGVEKVSYETRK